jgi:Na+/proline symporter
MGGLTTVYTMMGGITAVIWTDVVQSVVLVGGAVLALVLVILHVDGGVAEIWRAGMEQGKFELVNPTWSYAEGALWVILIGNIFANFYPATADQTIVQRYLTTKDEKSAARATWTNAALTLPVTVLFFALGTALWAYFRQHPMVLPGTMRNDAVLPVFMMAEFPSGARGLLISGVFAAAMSSLSSSMNSVASVVINDYYKRFIQPGVSELFALRLAQGITLVLGIAGTAASLYIVEIEAVSLWDPFLELLGLAGGGLAGIFALGIFVKRANYGGALTGAIASAAVLYFVRGYTDVNPMLFGMIGFLTALCIGWGVSLLMPPPKATNLPV